MKRGLIIFSLVLMLSLSIISAFSFSDYWNENWNKITGKQVSSTGNCVDGDGGANFNVKGTTSTPYSSETDYCLGNVLQEFYCFDYYGQQSIAQVEESCAKGCSNGACVVQQSQPSTTNPITPTTPTTPSGSQPNTTTQPNATSESPTVSGQNLTPEIPITSATSNSCYSNCCENTYVCDLGPAKSIDGNLGTRWASNRDNPGPANLSNPHYLIVDLGQVYAVTKITLVLHSSELQDYEIQYSSSLSSSWQTILNKKMAVGNQEHVLNPAINSRYFRIAITNSSDLGQASIYDIRFFESLVGDKVQEVVEDKLISGIENEDILEESKSDINKVFLEEKFYDSSKNWLSCSVEGVEVKGVYEDKFWGFFTLQKTDSLVNGCSDGKTLREYSCNAGKPAYKDYLCGGVCEENRCGKSPYIKFKRILVDGKFSYYTEIESNYLLDFNALTILVDTSDFGIPVESISFLDGSLPTFGSAKNQIVYTLNLYDDGEHNDGLANDGVYGNILIKHNLPPLVDTGGNILLNYYSLVIFETSKEANGWIWVTNGGKLILLKNQIDTKIPEKENLGLNCVPILYTGDSKENLDLVFVGDKWTDINEFKINIREKLIEMLSESTFNAYRNRINIWRVDELSSLKCTYQAECTIPGGVLGSFIEKLGGGGDAICCEFERIKNTANACPNDFAIAVDNTPLGNTPLGISSGVSGMVMYNRDNKLAAALFDSKFSPLKYFRIALFGNFHKFIGMAAVTSDADGRTVAHELGHLIARLPDYYEEDPSCERHDCMMCSAVDDFGNQDQCIDRARMVEQLNQFCEAKVTVFTKNPTSPYPNPFNPNSCSIKSDVYPGKCSQKVKYKVEYPKGGDPCYILMHIYDTKGSEVRVLVSDEPQPAGEYILEWDGTNNERNLVASGTYFYVVGGGRGSDSKTLKGTLIK